MCLIPLNGTFQIIFLQVFEKGKLLYTPQLIVLIQIAMDMHIALRKLKMTLLIHGKQRDKKCLKTPGKPEKVE